MPLRIPESLIFEVPEIAMSWRIVCVTCLYRGLVAAGLHGSHPPRHPTTTTQDLAWVEVA